MSAERIKWNTDNIPDEYPKNSDDNLINSVIQDLNDEYVTKKKNGKFNKIWEDIILQLIKSGKDELQLRRMTNKKRWSWFSMNNPLVYIFTVLILAFLAYMAVKLKLPLRFNSNDQELNQLKVEHKFNN